MAHQDVIIGHTIIVTDDCSTFHLDSSHFVKLVLAFNNFTPPESTASLAEALRRSLPQAHRHIELRGGISAGTREQILCRRGGPYFAGQSGGQKSQQLRAGASLAVPTGWFTA
jgi:hypothetical protein